MIPPIASEFIMRPQIVALPALLLSALLTLGCGGVKPTGTTATPSPYTFSGDWGANSTAIALVAVAQFVGDLTSSNGLVSGTLAPIGGGTCSALLLPPASASGTVDSVGHLTITMPAGGGTATLTATLGSNLNTSVAGTYQIAGGSCPMPATPMTIAEYAPVTGTYSGMFSVLSIPSNPNINISVTAVLTQSPTPDAIGAFPVTGTVTTTGACATSFTLSGSYVWGGQLLGGSSPQQFIGSFDPTASTSTFTFLSESVASPGCPNAPQIFAGSLTRQ